MPRDLPSGTVTLLFTDIEGSTRLLNELGAEAYDEALAEHRRLLREAFARRGGVEVDTQGDAFFYAFPSAPEAIEAAGEGQQALSVGPDPRRMGLHTGRPHVGREGYVGEDVHLAARIAAAGHGGQVLVSQATRALVDRELADLGEHRLKDFSEPVWIFQLGEERFPPLKTISNTNLPRPASSFVGREREVSDVVELLRDGARLVTLSGPGGSGKTRLAIESAAELVPEFRNGVFWIGLAALRDPALVAETVAQTLGAKDGLAEHIGERELLLLLDNFEQVVEARPELRFAARVLPEPSPSGDEPGAVACPGRGRVSGGAAGGSPRRSSSSAPAPGSMPSDDIAELCRRLDNLPLAVELAAARTSVLSPAQILERLAQRLDLLKGRKRCRGAAADAACHDRMEPRPASADEQRLFARLSVFAGGCTLEAAATVCGADLDTLQSLVDKSLVRHTEERFWMLETIREFALERLEETGGAEVLRERYSAVLPRACGAGEARAAWPGARRSGSTGSKLSTTTSAPSSATRSSTDAPTSHFGSAPQIRHFWWMRGYWSEGRRWLDSALAAGGESDPQLRFEPLWGAGLLAVWQGDVERGSAVAEEMLALATETDSSRAGAIAHGGTRCRRARRPRIRRSQLYEESARLARELGDYGHTSAIAVNNLGDDRVLPRGVRARARAVRGEPWRSAGSGHDQAPPCASRS